ncbi:MAG: DoxX family protein [Candidatus Pacebacteria bacterium]|nr:DoxX family protein [Candidatus Paceibacterota bacterium]
MNKEYIEKISNTGKVIAPTILRIGLALVFLWFGVNQIVNPTAWVAYIPDWVVSLSSLSAETIVYLNAAFEIFFGVALFLGFFTRFVSFFLMLHIFEITYTVGFDATGVRDFGLSVAALVVFLNGADFFTLDRFMKEESSSKIEDGKAGGLI